MRQIMAYIRALHSRRVVWMNGQEVGMMSDGTNDIYLWPYRHMTFEALCRTATHEAVHAVHPDLGHNDAAIEAIATVLLHNHHWQATVTRYVGQALLESLNDLAKQGVYLG